MVDDLKIVFLMTIHNRLDFLTWYLNDVYDSNDTMLISTANPNIKDVVLNVMDLYPKLSVKINTPDYGYYGGAQFNLINGLTELSIFDYVISIEPDNCFYDRDMLMKLISNMRVNNKHFLIEDEKKHVARDENGLCTNFVDLSKKHTGLPKYWHFDTLNIFSKYAIRELIPTDMNEFHEIFRLPLEDYFGMMFNIKHKFQSDQDIIDFFYKNGYMLNFEMHKTYFNEDNKDYHADRFRKYGMIGAQDNNFDNFISHIERHKPYLNT
jgi:hypothetical protein